MSATVIGERAADANALATTLSVLPVEDGLRLVSSMPGVECLLVTADGQVPKSDVWARYGPRPAGLAALGSPTAPAQEPKAPEGKPAGSWGDMILDVPAGPTGGDDDSRRVVKLEVVEHLRKAHGVRGSVAEFRADEKECVVTFKGPGYAADAFIARESGRYEPTKTLHGLVAVINDLHKGRDAGRAWPAVIDASAIILVAISFSGLALLFYLKRKRIPGLVVVFAGTVAVAAIVVLFVP